MNNEFTGCKLAYVFNGSLVVYKRDEFADIPLPGLWSFPLLFLHQDLSIRRK
ncbi:MAG: hypothetical protein ACI9ES_000974 [Oceanospirillaceae bacterium]|jgi:hypothetical protein